MKRLAVLILAAFSVFNAESQTILGKSSVDKLLPGFFTNNNNADTLLDGLNTNATHKLNGSKIGAGTVNSNTFDAGTLSLIGSGLSSNGPTIFAAILASSSTVPGTLTVSGTLNTTGGGTLNGNGAGIFNVDAMTGLLWENVYNINNSNTIDGFMAFDAGGNPHVTFNGQGLTNLNAAPIGAGNNRVLTNGGSMTSGLMYGQNTNSGVLQNNGSVVGGVYSNASFGSAVVGLSTNLPIGEYWAADYGYSSTNTASLNAAALDKVILVVSNAGGGTIRIGSRVSVGQSFIQDNGEHMFPPPNTGGAAVESSGRIKLLGDNNTTIQSTATTTAHAVLWGQVDMENINLIGAGTNAAWVYPFTNYVGIYEIGFNNPRVKNVMVTGFGQGIASEELGSINGAWYEQCDVVSCDIGWAVGEACDAMHLMGCSGRRCIEGLDAACLVPTPNNVPTFAGLAFTGTNVGSSRGVLISGGLWAYNNLMFVIGKGSQWKIQNIHTEFVFGGLMHIGHTNNTIYPIANETGAASIELDSDEWVGGGPVIATNITLNASGERLYVRNCAFNNSIVGVYGNLSYGEFDNTIMGAQTNFVYAGGSIYNLHYRPLMLFSGTSPGMTWFSDEVGANYNNGDVINRMDAHLSSADTNVTQFTVGTIDGTFSMLGDRHRMSYISEGTFGMLSLNNASEMIVGGNLYNSQTNAASYEVVTNGLTATSITATKYIGVNTNIQTGTNVFLDFAKAQSTVFQLTGGSNVFIYVTNALGLTNLIESRTFTLKSGPGTVTVYGNTNWSGWQNVVIPGKQLLILNVSSMGPGDTNKFVLRETIAPDTTFAVDPDFLVYSAAAGTTNWAVNTLIQNIKSIGLWMTNGLFYPMLPDNGAKSVVLNAFNSGFNISTNGQLYYTNGFASDGSAGYGDTGFNPTSQGWTSSNATMFVVADTSYSPAANAAPFGAAGVSGGRFAIQLITGNFVDNGVNDAGGGNVAAPATQIALVRTNNQTEFAFGDLGIQSFAQAATTPPNGNFYVGARNNAGPSSYYKGNVRMVLVISNGITFSQYVALSNAVNVYLSGRPYSQNVSASTTTNSAPLFFGTNFTFAVNTLYTNGNYQAFAQGLVTLAATSSGTAALQVNYTNIPGSGTIIPISFGNGSVAGQAAMPFSFVLSPLATFSFTATTSGGSVVTPVNLAIWGLGK